MQASPARLLRDIRALVKPGWKVRVTISRVRTGIGETELARLLLRGSDLIGIEGPVEVDDEPASSVPANLAGFVPSELQRLILAALAGGPRTTGEIAHACGVSTGRLFDRGKVMHELIERGLVRKAKRGYELTEAGQEFVAAQEP